MTRRTAGQEGLALLAVLVVLGILMALLAPFLLSMSHAANSVEHHLDRTQTDLAVESGRDAVLFRAARFNKAVDPTPSADGLEETRIRFSAPDAYAALADGKTHLLTGESEDEQQRANLTSITPLLLGNLLDLATFTAAKVTKEAKELMVLDPSGFPDTGYVVVDGELMHYGGKQGSNLTQLERGLLNWDKDPESPFSPAHEIEADTLVIDMRVRLAVTWPFDDGGNARRAITPWRSVDELTRIGELPFGAFTREMVDRLRPHVTTWSTRMGAAEWLRPERIFSNLTSGLDRKMIVRSGEYLGPGTVVRITGDGQEEFALVRRSEPKQVRGKEVTLSSIWEVTLDRPVLFTYRETHAFVEAMAPHPINANTASLELLTAVLRGIQQRPGIQRDGHPVTNTPLPRAQAEELARALVALRDTPDSQGRKLLLSGWEDLVERWIKPLLTTDILRANQLVNVYRNILHARDAGPAMGTAPLCFVSDPVVRFRSASATLSGVGLERARREVQGFAHVIPGGELIKALSGQDQFEEELRLTRESPGWTSGPNNTGSSLGGTGANPANRYLAHLLPTLHGLAARFPTKDPAESFVQARPANLRLQQMPGGEYTYQDFFDSAHSDGRDLDKEGPYEITETGRGRAGGAGGPGGGGQRRGSGNKGSFGFAGASGLMRPFATSFWCRLRDLSEQTLFDLSDSEDTRNRVALHIKEARLQCVVYDAAGQDPEFPDQPTAGIFEVPLTDLRVQGDQWLHVNAHADGTRPDQMSLLTDGALKGKARYRTYLTQQVPAYRPSGDRFGDRGRYPTLTVESTEGFPDFGVLRIGGELFEYTSKAGSSFVCERAESRGGRAARMAMGEFNLARMTGGQGFNEEQLSSLDEAPSHAAGSAVELYGYSSSFLANTTVPNGAARLTTPLGPWGVAKLKTNTSTVSFGLGQASITLGRGIDTRYSGDLELDWPMVPPPAGSSDFMKAFVTSGGYAVLLQRYINAPLQGPGNQGGPQVIAGGLEIIRYGGVNGNKLTGVQRGIASLPPDLDQKAQLPYFSGAPQAFVSEWTPNLIAESVNGPLIRDPENFPQLFAFVVPISIPAVGNEPDPVRSGYAEWVQIYPGKGTEFDTEWVRYDAILERHLIRSRVAAVQRLFTELVTETRTQQRPITPGSGVEVGALVRYYQYPQPPRFPSKEIGYPDDFEISGASGNQSLPHYAARTAFRFRGDPTTGTSSHAQPANAQQMPAIRMELRRQQYPSALSPRLGRDDRIAFVAGDDALSSLPPEWHTANWCFRKFSDDADARDNAGNPLPAVGRDLTGPHCQLIALKAGLTLPTLLGATQIPVDVRLVDRVLKFPSGELPAKTGTAAWLGGKKGSRIPPARGFVDELSILTRNLPHVQSTEPTSWYLSGTVAEGAGALVVAEFGLRAPNGLRGKNGGGRVAPIFKQGGGLLLCDGELIAYESVEDNGTVQIAQNGRGLLGTIRRAHDEGAAVSFLDEVPTTTLTGGMTASSPTAAVQSVSGFPMAEGTFLCEQELIHHTWSRVSPDGPGIFEMPEHRRAGTQRQETSTARSGGGLFRGRFGTAPSGHASGTPVIFFPIRYWDRYVEFADDPELHYFGVQLAGPDLYVQGLYWEDETFDATCKPLALLRTDQVSPWSGVPVEITEKGELKPPDAVPGLFRFKQGRIEDKPNKLQLQASQFEVRLFHVYQGGAFDPVLFNAPGWKTAPRVRNIAIPYQGETRILEQKETTR